MKNEYNHGVQKLMSSIDCQKIVILGNPGVGKTSIIQRYVHNKFQDSYSATLGFNIYTRYVTIGDKKIGLSIWDIGGQEVFKKFAFKYLVEADAAIFVTDVTKPESIDNLNLWNDELDRSLNRKIPKIILFNKIDLGYDMNLISGKIADTEIRSVFNGIVFASAKTGENIEDIFFMIGKMLTNWNEEFGIPQKLLVNFEGAFEEHSLPILFFSSKDCTNCHLLFNSINELSNEFPLSIKVIDIDSEFKIAKQYGISSLPTAIIGNKTVVGNSNIKLYRMIIADEYKQMLSRK